ncbi:MAG TPA: transcription-repair coupling factor, partial [Rhodothermales bacterium]|nr:transcription-repair coupling factor [Rhodothermales bacterium]
MVCLTSNSEDAAYLFADLELLAGAESAQRIRLFPASGVRPYDEEQTTIADPQVARMDLVLALQEGFGGIVVTSAEAVFERVPSPNALRDDVPLVRVGQVIAPERLMEQLVDLGFSIENFVEEAGELAYRGGIVDVFPFAGRHPVRIEFFGDEIESIREFDPGSQRSVSHILSARLVPDPAGLSFGGQRGSFFAFLPETCRLAIVDQGRFLESARGLFVDAAKARDLAVEKGAPDDQLGPVERRYCLPDELAGILGSSAGVCIESRCEEPALRFEVSAPPVFNKSVQLLRKKIAENTGRGWETIILCDGKGQSERIDELLGGRNERLNYQLETASLHEGFELPGARLAVYTDHQIFNRYHRPRVRKVPQVGQRLSLQQLASLKPGDLVVHVDHGIGRFAGLEKIDVRGREQEVVRLMYESDDLLYVNINSLHRLHKYSNREGHQPKLTRLGSGQWERAKSRAKKRVKDIARDLIKLYAERKSADGYAFAEDSVWQRELEAAFRYEDTPDQSAAAEDVKRDMEQPVPMDRLVCGDVGFGKTEVAVRAAFKAVQDGKQVAILAPTTILADQHFETFQERLADYPVRVDVLSRFRTPAEQKETVRKVADGQVDVLIGTHRLVSKDVEFKALGLLVIDEEQRFGVSVKEKLRRLRAEVDTLTLTATPIPRTLQFSLMGARDLSIINTPPPNRQPIVTEIHSFDKKLIRDAIMYEVERGGQVFYVHNRVRTIDETAAMLGTLAPGVRFGVAHGQMKGSDLENVMHRFVSKAFDVLVCTNIVESGLDVTNANTMVLDRADRFGLADLHQLRGRVGRSDRRAFCYLLVPSVHQLTREARQRLRAIEEFSDLGSGFNIAMRDLDIRGAGNLLGAEQSGFIDEIGFETYHRILDEAVRELRSEEFGSLFDETPRAEPVECTVDLDTDALLPVSYVSSSPERLNIYRRLNDAPDAGALAAIREELHDRFGDVPSVVDNLLRSIKVRRTGQRLRLPRIQWKNDRLFLTL